ncbi:MAG TPA: hypothetical protein VF195_03110 [Actinomycetota bacterium]
MVRGPDCRRPDRGKRLSGRLPDPRGGAGDEAYPVDDLDGHCTTAMLNVPVQGVGDVEQHLAVEIRLTAARSASSEPPPFVALTTSLPSRAASPKQPGSLDVTSTIEP